MNIELLELNDIWPQADYVTMHVPLIPATENLVNADVLSRCKKGVKIINVARGGIVNEQDLLAGLENGSVGGAALDVFVEVGYSPDLSVFIYPNRVHSFIFRNRRLILHWLIILAASALLILEHRRQMLS